MKHCDLYFVLTIHRDYRLTWQDGYGHRCVHQEQHVEEQKAQIAEHLSAIVTYVVVKSSDEEANKEMGEQTQVHQSLREQNIDICFDYDYSICYWLI